MDSEHKDSKFAKQYGKDDPRLGELVLGENDHVENVEVAIIGFPNDEGVRRNGGRVGAAKGPAEFRNFICKIGTLVNPEFGIDLRHLKVKDFGNINPQLELELAHKELTNRVKEVLEKGAIPWIVGGGNDQSYANARGFLEAKTFKGTVGVVNIDAHLDVRPLKEGKLAHSGSPFRQLLEDPLFQERNGTFVEFASQGHQCSTEHWDYVNSHKRTKIIPLSKLRGSVLGGLSHQIQEAKGVTDTFFKLINGEMGDHVFVSFDIDSIASEFCPGVSAPANIGLTADEALNISYLSGKSPFVRLVDISEYNPDVELFRTGRLVVLMFYYFLLGYSQRPKAH